MKNSNFVLTALGVVGYGLGLYFASEEFPEAEKHYQTAVEWDGTEMDHKHKTLFKLQYCKKTIATYILSTTAIIAGQKITYDKMAIASAAITASGRELYKNRKVVKELFGQSAEDILAEKHISTTNYSNTNTEELVYDNELGLTYYDVTLDDIHRAFRVVNEELAKKDHVDVIQFYEALLDDSYHNDMEYILDQWKDYVWWGCDILSDSMDNEVDPLKNPIIRYEVIPHKSADGQIVYAFEFTDIPSCNPFR